MKPAITALLAAAALAALIVTASIRSTTEPTKPDPGSDSAPAEDASVEEPARDTPYSNPERFGVGDRDYAENGAGKVVFADGEEAVVAWRQRPAEPEIAAPYIVHIRDLQAAAGHGEAAAAYALYDILGQQCSHVHESWEELSRAIERLYQTHSVTMPGMDPGTQLSGTASIDEIAAGMQQRYEACYGITAEQKTEASRWLKLAAEAGYTKARMTYAARTSDLDSAIEQLELAWQDGEHTALAMLSDKFVQRSGTGRDPEDTVQASAARYAYTALNRALYDAGARLAEPGRDRMQQQLDRMTASLLPHELDEAVRLAKERVRSNPRCCYSR